VRADAGGAVELPAVVGTLQAVAADRAHCQVGAAVDAAAIENPGLAVGVAEDDESLAEQLDRLRYVDVLRAGDHEPDVLVGLVQGFRGVRVVHVISG
jgi:hypothetical protein